MTLLLPGLLQLGLLAQAPPVAHLSPSAQVEAVPRRLAVVVLPTIQLPPEPGAGPLEVATLARVHTLLKESLASRGDLRLVALDGEALAILLDLPACQQSPRCLGPLLPPRADRVLHVALGARPGGATIWLRWEAPERGLIAEGSGFLPASPDAAWASAWLDQLDLQLGGAGAWSPSPTAATAP